MNIPLEKYVTGSGIEVYIIRCRMYRSMIGRVQVIPSLAAVIDTGSEDAASRQDVLDGFEHLKSDFGVNFTPADVKRVLITHSHIDHLGGLPLFTSPQIERCIHLRDRQMATEHKSHFAHALECLDRFFAFTETPFSEQPRIRNAFLSMGSRTIDYSFERFFDDNDIIDGFQVIPVPGHSKGHSNFLLDDVLFTGDHILSQTMAPVWPKIFGSTLGYQSYYQSLVRVEKLVESGQVKTFLPSHEQTIVHPALRLDTIRIAQQRRFNKIRDIIEQTEKSERLTGWEIAQRIFAAPTDFFAFVGLLDVGTRLEYLSYLDSQNSCSAAT